MKFLLLNRYKLPRIALLLITSCCFPVSSFVSFRCSCYLMMVFFCLRSKKLLLLSLLDGIVQFCKVCELPFVLVRLCFINVPSPWCSCKFPASFSNVLTLVIASQCSRPFVRFLYSAFPFGHASISYCLSCYGSWSGWSLYRDKQTSTLPCAI